MRNRVTFRFELPRMQISQKLIFRKAGVNVFLTPNIEPNHIIPSNIYSKTEQVTLVYGLAQLFLVGMVSLAE